jgi:acid phosphatase type 7
VTKGPYLQGLGTNGVTIKVELSEPGPARVEVWADDGAGVDGGRPAAARRESTEPRAFHVLRVDNLQPSTRYIYRVTAGGTTPDAGHFTTAPADARPFRFLVYGDSRSDPEAHAAVVRAMEQTPSDFLVNTGDMVELGSEPADWQTLFTIEGHLLRDRCAFVAVGNHELARGEHTGEVAFLRYFATVEEGHDLDRLYGSFRWGDTRFFVLNAMDRWTGDERAWLKAELDRAADEPGLRHRFAVLHWSPWSSGPHGNNPALENGEVVTMMHDRKVDLVLAGHDHAYERGEGKGLKYVVTGGAGAPLYPKKHAIPETLRYESAYHFLEVLVDGDHVTVTAKRPAGGAIETCGFQGGGGWDCDAPKPGAPASPSPAAAAPSRSGSCGCALPGRTGGSLAHGALVVMALLAVARRRW